MFFKLNAYLDVLHSVLPWLLWVFLGVMGAVMGSFLTCALYRVPRQISLVYPPSSCPSCNKRLRCIDLIPVLSFILFKGRCRQCKTRISFRYVLLELLCIFMGLFSFALFGPHINSFFMFVLSLCCVYLLWGWVESRHIGKRVLLFFIILLLIFLFMNR